jgi:peroxidase
LCCHLQYFKNLLNGRGLLNTDAGLLQTAETKRYVLKFAKKQSAFFLQYTQSLLKLSEFGVLLSPKGEIRMHCERVLDDVK